MESLLKIEKVASMLDISPKTIRKWLAERKIASVKVGVKSVRISSGEVQRIIEAGKREKISL
jgi:excisionase family DNA binding protein